MADSQTPTAERLRSRLKELGWTQVELAAAVRASTANVSRWLSGDRTPSLRMAFRIQRSAVGIPADAWITHDEEDDADASGEHSAIDPDRAAG